MAAFIDVEHALDPSYAAKCGPQSEAANVKGKSSVDGSECKGVAFHFVEVNFSEIKDPKERDYLKALPTSFVLSDEAVDHLIAAGRNVLRDNSEFKRLMADIQ